MVWVKTKGSKFNFLAPVHASDRLVDFKARVEEACGIPPGSQRIVLLRLFLKLYLGKIESRFIVAGNGPRPLVLRQNLQFLSELCISEGSAVCIRTCSGNILA